MSGMLSETKPLLAGVLTSIMWTTNYWFFMRIFTRENPQQPNFIQLINKTDIKAFVYSQALCNVPWKSLSHRLVFNPFFCGGGGGSFFNFLKNRKCNASEIAGAGSPIIKTNCFCDFHIFLFYKTDLIHNLYFLFFFYHGRCHKFAFFTCSLGPSWRPCIVVKGTRKV